MDFNKIQKMNNMTGSNAGNGSDAGMDDAMPRKMEAVNGQLPLTGSGNFSEEEYDGMIRRLFVRFPSFQKDGKSAYKPGIANMEFFDQLNGHPHRKYVTVHVAGTNGKGSVCSMLASVLASAGLKTGVYTSPHILDFRERMKIVEGAGAGEEKVPDADMEGQCRTDAAGMGFRCRYIEKKDVWDFVRKWEETFDHLDLSFFEITTSMAFDWFAGQNVDVAVVETGLGGRLDSTNIISPVLSVITNIGLDHCDMLGNTLPEIAFEKAGIIKPETPVVVGESDPETDPVFERKVLYSNLSSEKYMGNRGRIMSLLTFADKVEPSGWDRRGEILEKMDLKGEYQARNLRTVLAAVDVLRRTAASSVSGLDMGIVEDAVEHAAARAGFHGRWETLSENPHIICDIGHNAHGLKYNFHQLNGMLVSGKCSGLIVAYGSVADKDYESVFPLMPADATYIFTNASNKRACGADVLCSGFEDFCRREGRPCPEVHVAGSVEEAVLKALDLCRAGEDGKNDADSAVGGAAPLVYIGGSTYVVSEAVAALEKSGLVSFQGDDGDRRNP